MSWWLAIGLGYLVLCWIGWIVCLRISWAEEYERDRAITALLRQHPQVFWIAISLALVVMGPSFPLFMVQCAWTTWRERRDWRKFKRTHREMILEPIHPANIPQAGQDHIERCSPVMQRLEFLPAGFYLLKPEPYPIYAQCLLSRAGETVVDVSLIDDVATVSFVSVLDNGHVLETGCCAGGTTSSENIESINRSGRFTARMIEPEADETYLVQVYSGHLAALAELERQFGCGTLHLALDQVPVVKRYDNAVFGEVLFGQGKKDNRPQPVQCPTGISKRVSLAACVRPILSEV